jgi:hypothetical protein
MLVLEVSTYAPLLLAVLRHYQPVSRALEHLLRVCNYVPVVTKEKVQQKTHLCFGQS